MGKTVGFLGWLFVVLTIISLLFTLTTAHQIQYIDFHFKYYSILQVCIFFTMIFWAIILFRMNTGGRRIVYSSICVLFAVCMVLLRLIYGVY